MWLIESVLKHCKVAKYYYQDGRFTYRACGGFAKNKERIKKIKETGDLRYICQNEIDKACF